MRAFRAMSVAVIVMATCGAVWALLYLPTQALPGHWDFAWHAFAVISVALYLALPNGSRKRPTEPECNGSTGDPA